MLLKPDLDVQQTCLCLFNKSSCSASSLTLINMYLISLCYTVQVWLRCSTNSPQRPVYWTSKSDLSCTAKWDKNHGNSLVTLKQWLSLSICSEAGKLNKGSCLASALGVTKVIFVIHMRWVWSHFVVLLKLDLDVQQTHFRGQFVEHQSRT